VSARLYFEPLTLEDVLEVYRAEAAAGPIAGVIVQLGGQTPLSLAAALQAEGLPVVGTSPTAIDLAEDRERFGAVLAEAGLSAPAYGTAADEAQTARIADRIGYPVLVRPSYVLGGRGMEIVYSREQLRDYFARRRSEGGGTSGRSAPLLIDRFLDAATEIDVDALYDGRELYLAGVMEHVEECGIHSGDSTCVLPPVTLSQSVIDRIRAATEAIAAGVGVRGLLNVQFGLMQDALYVIEANPRASRTVPFVSKATGVSVAEAAAWIMMGRSIARLREDGALPSGDAPLFDMAEPVAVKGVVLPFKRFTTADGQVVDTVLGPEMRSTGEAMGIAATFPTAFAKSEEGSVGRLPEGGTAFISVTDRDKGAIVLPALQLAELGFTILATSGTAAVLTRYGVPTTVVRKKSEGRGRDGEPTIVDLISAGEVDVVVNTPASHGTRADGYAIRTATTSAGKTILTTVQAFAAAVQAIAAMRRGEEDVVSLQEYDAARLARRS
jgi:carbamoyl-phosphate synthase large chain